MDDWPQQLSIYRGNYTSRQEYNKALAEAGNHYDHKVKVSGGYMFFEFANDYKTWRKQR